MFPNDIKLMNFLLAALTVLRCDVSLPLCSTYQRPDKETAIQEKLSRFARDNISEKELLCSNC